MKRKVCAWLLMVVMILSMTACGKGESEGPEFVYVPEYISLPADEDSNVNVMQMTDKNLYYSVYSWNEETMESSQDFYSLDLTAADAKPVKMQLDMDTMGDYMQMQIDSQGNLYLATRSYEEITEKDENGETYTSYDYENAKVEIVKFGADGTESYRCDITQRMKAAQEDEYISDYIQYMVLDKAGNVYVTNGDTNIWVIGTDGKLLCEIKSDNWFNSMGVSKAGDVYISTYGNSGQVLKKIDLATKGFGEELSGLPNNFYGAILPGTEKDFVLQGDSALYEYDAQTQTYEEILKFIDCDINGSYVQNVAVTQDGKILVYYRDWNLGTQEVVSLVKKPASEVSQKQMLTLGGFYINQDLQSSIVKFNKSNEEYRITIRDYSESMGDDENAYEDAITLMNNDILTGNAPDMIYLGSVNLQTMANKGVIEDLSPYLESSDKLKREDMLESVLKTYTIGDTLCAIPTSFYISTLMSASSIVGDEMGWTMDEMLAVAKSMPEDAQLMQYGTKDMILQYMIIFGADSYVNWETGKCNFESEEFIKLLEFANTFPKEYEYSEDMPTMPEMIQSGKLLLVDQSISSMGDYQIIETIWDEPVTCIGFPGNEGNGAILMGQDAIAISSKSKHKDVAWEFLETFITDANAEENYMWGFPVVKSRLEAQFEEAMKPEYEIDWMTGETLLDENGNPVESSKGGWGYGDGIEFNIYAATQEQVDAVKELINNTTTLYNADMEMYNIISEEAAFFFEGQKSAQEVAKTIQGRIQVYVDEIR